LVLLLPYSTRRLGDIHSFAHARVFIPTGLAPQKAVEVDGADPTRDTYQRKVFFDGTNFFVVYWDLGDKKVYYVASADGGSWTSRTELWEFSVAPYYGGNIDVCYPNRGTLDTNGDPVDFAMYFTGSNGAISQWRPFVISSQTLTEETGGSLGVQQQAQGGSIVSNLNASRDYCIFHRVSPDVIRTHRSPAMQDDSDSSVSHGGTTTGGNQLLPYKTSSPYKMLALAKGGDNKLYHNIVTEPTATFANSFIEIATLGTGFSDFCACSEAQNASDPEIIHLVYIKSSGELCYRKFESDSWASERVLEVSGTSYPTIAVGTDDKLYVFYVKDGKIWVKYYNGRLWFRSVELFTDEHTYNTPTYLSCSQNIQSERICLTWTEKTSTPYEVWFCYLEE